VKEQDVPAVVQLSTPPLNFPIPITILCGYQRLVSRASCYTLSTGGRWNRGLLERRRGLWKL